MKFQYSLNGSEWFIKDEISFDADDDLSIRVAVEDFDDTKKDYSFTAKLA